jgi:hypothetical protein
MEKLTSNVFPSATAMSATFLYRCPVTGYRVQGFIADSPAEKNGRVYEAVMPLPSALCARRALFCWSMESQNLNIKSSQRR